MELNGGEDPGKVMFIWTRQLFDSTCGIICLLDCRLSMVLLPLLSSFTFNFSQELYFFVGDFICW